MSTIERTNQTVKVQINSNETATVPMGETWSVYLSISPDNYPYIYFNGSKIARIRQGQGNEMGNHPAVIGPLIVTGGNSFTIEENVLYISGFVIN